MKKEHDRKTRIEKAKLLGDRWAMLRWISNFIKENEEKWTKERIEKEEIERKELNEWNKAKRLEKVALLKKKWTEEKDKEKVTQENLSQNTSLETTPSTPPHPPSTKEWTVWRTKEKLPETTETEGFDTEKENLDQMLAQVSYDVTNLETNKKFKIKEEEKQPIEDTKTNESNKKKLFLKPPSKEQNPTTKKPRNNNKNNKNKNNIPIDEKQTKIDIMFKKKADTVPHQHQQLGGQKRDQTSPVDDRAVCTSFVKLCTNSNLKFLPDPESEQPDLATKLQNEKLLPGNLNLKKNSNPSKNKFSNKNADQDSV